MNLIKTMGILFLCTFFIGCVTEESEIATREMELMLLINEDDALGISGLDDGGAREEDFTVDSIEVSAKVLAREYDLFHPDSGFVYRFGRRLISKTKTVSFTHDESETIADIVHTVSGEFVCVAIDTTFEPDSTVMDTSKSFTSEFYRKIRFTRVPSPMRNRWKIDAFTVGSGTTGDLVGITDLKYEKLDHGTGEWLSIFSMHESDIDSTWISRDSIPTFSLGDSIKIEVTVVNTSAEAFDHESGESVIMHYGRHHLYKARKRMHDDGIVPDAILNDDTFTKTWYVHGPGYHSNGAERVQRVFRTFFDVIDYSTLFDANAGVHSAVWLLPYKVIRN